ncbi:MAG: DNA polymerase III subunit delta [Verrucomicrobiales bacterium]|nr:DNA polymerase III subunit delta [Verrucomicrobiales bacterium]MCP5528691.1 DNA polymerase III subunit delta [Verrucomicrobiales bacterium]
MPKKAVSPKAPPPGEAATAPLALVWGDDDYSVKQRARQLYDAWCAAAGGMDHETIDGAAENADQALRAVNRVREALQTLPFFGGAKVVWLKDCNFAGEDRVSSAQSVTKTLSEFASELQAMRWDGVRLLISAGKLDRRRAFYKTLASLAAVEECPALSAADKDWVSRAEAFVRGAFQRHHQTIEPGALAELIARVGPNLRLLAGEAEKLSLYAGERKAIAREDVVAITSRTHQAEAFAVAEALGDRDLPHCLGALDEELWQIRTDRDRSAIGLLYGLISKVRVLLLVKELVHLGYLREGSDYQSVKNALARLPEGLLPADKRYNPAAMHPFPVFKALGQARHYRREELVAAMERLLRCNLKLVSSTLEDALILQQTVVEIIGVEPPGRGAAGRRPANPRAGGWR